MLCGESVAAMTSNRKNTGVRFTFQVFPFPPLAHDLWNSITTSCLIPDTSVRDRTACPAPANSSALQPEDFRTPGDGTEDAPAPLVSKGAVYPMKKTERMRQPVPGSLSEADFKEQSDRGWKLVAVEWEREIETSEAQLPGDVPFGLRVAADAQRLEEDPVEREVLVELMELLVEEGSYARIADEINRRGYRTRQGTPWTPISVFEMLPRLIEVGPFLFRSSEWAKRRQLVRP